MASTSIKLFRRFAADQSGATAIEYSLLAGLITTAIIVALRSIGTTTSAKFNAVAANLS